LSGSPHPLPLSRKGERGENLGREAEFVPSPLAGEGGAQAPGEGFDGELYLPGLIGKGE